eukprot:1157477-Pelagomonas_calceolata.AAC.3
MPADPYKAFCSKCIHEKRQLNSTQTLRLQSHRELTIESRRKPQWRIIPCHAMNKNKSQGSQMKALTGHRYFLGKFEEETSAVSANHSVQVLARFQQGQR